MKRWTIENGAACVSGTAQELIDSLTGILSGFHDPNIKLIAVGICSNWCDRYASEAVIELYHGINLHIQCGGDEEIERFFEEGWIDCEEVAAVIKQRINDYLHYGYGHLQASMHEALTTARKKFAELGTAAMGFRLKDIRFYGADSKSAGYPIVFQVRYFGIDHLLQATISDFITSQISEIDKLIDQIEPMIRERFEALNSACHKGGDGFVDQITINALGLPNHSSIDIREVFSCDGVNLYPELTVSREAAHLTSMGTVALSPKLSWCKNFLTIRNQQLPETVLRRVIGNPITELIVHPLLSSNMIIANATNAGHGKASCLELTIDQPTLVFCAQTGLFWHPSPSTS